VVLETTVCVVYPIVSIAESAAFGCLLTTQELFKTRSTPGISGRRQLMDCEECEGTGKLFLSHPNDPVDRFIPCEDCGGSGERDVDLRDLDGEIVIILETGFIGECNVTACGTVIVMNEQEEEVELLGNVLDQMEKYHEGGDSLRIQRQNKGSLPPSRSRRY